MVDFVLDIHRKLANFKHEIDHISKTNNRKNRKIDYSLVSENCALFWTKKWKQLFLRGGGNGVGRGKGLHVVTRDKAESTAGSIPEICCHGLKLLLRTRPRNLLL